MIQQKIKRSFIIIVLIMMVISIMPFHHAQAAVSTSAKAAILMDQTSGRVLYGKNIHTPMRIASITKVMTAILAIESGKMNKTVTISGRAAGTEGSSIYLKKGEHIKLKDLVYGLMLRSGNDAAVAIAEAVGGSMEGFVYMMNKKAQELGMKDTNFDNPHGLDTTDTHLSSAYDMALLTRYAMKNPQFQKIFSTKKYSAPQEGEKWNRLWRNKNKLLFRYEFSTGGKTGYTKLARRTLISTAKKGDMGLIVVTLNDSNDWADHTNLCNWGFKNYHMVTIAKRGPVTGIKNKFYKNHLYTKRALVYPLTKKEEKALSTSITLAHPPENRKKVPTPAGMLYVKLNGEPLTQLPLFYSKTKPKPEKESFWKSFQHLFMSSLGIRYYD